MDDFASEATDQAARVYNADEAGMLCGPAHQQMCMAGLNQLIPAMWMV
jgi:hypothetical protein